MKSTKHYGLYTPQFLWVRSGLIDLWLKAISTSAGLRQYIAARDGVAARKHVSQLLLPSQSCRGMARQIYGSIHYKAKNGKLLVVLTQALKAKLIF
jgi:hypothetical protein